MESVGLNSLSLQGRHSIQAGPAGDQIVEGMRAAAAGAGATLTLCPEFVTGFLRLASA